MYALLAILSLSILISIIFSFKAVWLKRFKYVPEEKILSFANELKEHYLKDPSIDNDNLNKKLINNIRRNILRQYTLSIETNHKHNNSRRIARNLSFLFIVTSISLAFIMIFLILIKGIFPNFFIG